MDNRDPIIMPVKPGTLTAEAKAAVQAAGIILIECEDPDAIRLVRPLPELESGPMLCAAVKAISNSPTPSVLYEFLRDLKKALDSASMAPTGEVKP